MPLRILLSSLLLLCAISSFAQGRFKADGNVMVSYYISNIVHNRAPVEYAKFEGSQENVIGVTVDASPTTASPGVHITFEPYLNKFIKLGVGLARQSFRNSYRYDITFTTEGNDTLQASNNYREVYSLNQIMLRGLGTTRIEKLVIQAGIQINYNLWDYNSELPPSAAEDRPLTDAFGATLLFGIGYDVSSSATLFYEYGAGQISSHKAGLRFSVF